MSYFEALILGCVQGLTEFLPISSSGHLILLRDLFSITSEGGVLFDVMLHVATATAVIVYFRKDVWRLLTACFNFCTRRVYQKQDVLLVTSLVIATIPAALLGYFFEGTLESIFRSTDFVLTALVVGAAIMWLADRVYKRTSEPYKDITIGRASVIGLFQSLALLPGMSRSGSTISGGIFMGLSRVEATRFSFLLALPIILGGGITKLTEVGGSVLTGTMLLGTITAFAVGLAAIHGLVTYLKNHTFTPFILYRIVLVISIIALS